MSNAAAIRWFKQTFGEQIAGALTGTPFDLDMIVAVACQETGYIWARLYKQDLATSDILALCVGDTIDYSGPKKGRQAFPKTKAELLGHANGQAMFDVARGALVELAKHLPGDFGGAAANPDKFCRGFGVFQRDLQFFKIDPDYFLKKRYEDFGVTLAQCMAELKRAAKKLDLDTRADISDEEFAHVAIAYNTGGYKPSKGLKQGYFNGEKYYGEQLYDYIKLSRSVKVGPVQPSVGRFVVVARGGLWLRKGPGTAFDPARLLETGTEMSVMAFDGLASDWARVDLGDDGLIDGHVSAAFIAPVAGAAAP